MRRLSRPVHALKDHYAVVVVGSGYGGGVSASRLARTGRSVCVLERGRELHPGEFPATLWKAAREAQVRTQKRHLGSSTGLFDFHVGPDISVLVGCGLGGTSLINANVALQPETHIFDDPSWPPELRGAHDALLKQGYDRAIAMLSPSPYPEEQSLPKLGALAESAHEMGGPLKRPPINVSFTDHVNAAGVFQRACTNCGDCVTGCNVGAKNTVLMNYLPDAVHHGAEVFTEIEVRTVSRREDGRWQVEFRALRSGQPRFGGPTMFVTADVVILAAGTLGSTEILLRSRQAGLPLSSRLGRHFTGNGDVLAFAYDATQTVNGVGMGRRHNVPAVGPTITGMIDLRGPETPLDQQVMVQEGSVPGAIARILPIGFAATAAMEDEGAGIAKRVAEVLGGVAGTFGGAYRGPVHRTQTYLVMSNDDGHGRLVLDGDRVRVEWPNIGERPVFNLDNKVLAEAAHGIGATFLTDPLWTRSFDKGLVTVHPLGGCGMAADAQHGVVNHKGQVFTGSSPTDVYDGLYVADGSIAPRPLGVNPLLTISALAERNAALLAQDRGWTITDGSGPPAPPPTPPAPAGIEFSETMRGFIGADAATFEAGEAAGKDDASRIEFVVTIVADDLPKLLAEPVRPARLFGTVTAPALSAKRLTVVDGEFILFEQQPDEVETWWMKYRMTLVSEEGRRFQFNGHKVIHNHPGLDMWSDTTTLYVSIHEQDGPLAAKGIMRLGVRDFVRQMSTMRVTRAPSDLERAALFNRFVRTFFGTLLHVYGGALDEAGAFLPKASLDREPLRALSLPTPSVEYCHADETWDSNCTPDVWLRLTRYKGGAKGPVLLAPGFGMSTAAFITDTIDTNIGEYLVANGYDVWLFDYRASTDLPSARSDFTLDDIAQKDWPAAVERVCTVSGAASVQVVAHCMGSMTFQMAMLSSPKLRIRSGVCSQVTVHPVSSALNRFKGRIHLGRLMQWIGMKRIHPDRDKTLGNELLDLGLRLIPVPSDERCDNAVCRWIAGFYGLTHHHPQLNQATHDDLGRLFDVGDLTCLNHISLCVEKEMAVGANGDDNAYLAHPERLAIPLLFLAGRKNLIFYPESSARTVRWLREHNDPALYRRHVFRNYAHLDGFVGKHADTDVYPVILRHLDEHNPGTTDAIDLTPQPTPVDA